MQVSKCAGPLAVGVKRYQTELICPWSGCEGSPTSPSASTTVPAIVPPGPREGDGVHEVVVRGLTRRRWRGWRWRRRRWWWRGWRRRRRWWARKSDHEGAHDVRMRVAVIRDRPRREVHEPRLTPCLRDAGGGVRGRPRTCYTSPPEVEVVRRSTCRPPAPCMCPSAGSAVEVVSPWVAEGDLLASSSSIVPISVPPARRAVIRRGRRITSVKR